MLSLHKKSRSQNLLLLRYSGMFRITKSGPVSWNNDIMVSVIIETVSTLPRLEFLVETTFWPPLQCCILLNSLCLSWLHLLHHVLQTVVGRVECVRRVFGLVCPVLALPVSRPLHCSALHLGAAPHHTHHQLSGVVWSQDGGGGAVLGHSTTTIILYSNINISLSSYSVTSSINV